MIYYASFVPGMREVISRILTERLSDITIQKLLDGAVVFETECTYDRLNFFCFNNIFEVIDILESGASAEFHIRKLLGKKDALSEKAAAVISENNSKIKTFRLVCSSENKPVAVNENLKREMENFIARCSGMKTNRAKSDTEFWFLSRREGFSCFMKRLSNHGPVESGRERGELSPHLAWLLCRIAGLKHGESAADPFCGYGSIPEAGCKHFHVKKFYASDTDARCVKIAKDKRALKNERAEIYRSDVSSVFDFIDEGEIDAIVTDPPWGMFKETTVPLQALYNAAAAIFAKMLKAGGRAVILTAAGKELENAIEKTNAFTINGIFPVLVSGKKAAVYSLELFGNRRLSV